MKRRRATPNFTNFMKLSILPNGLRIASRECPGVETAAVGLYAEAGSRHEPARLNGIAHLFEHMVFKGAGGRSAREISETIEDVGGDLNACTDRDGTNFTASVLAEHVPLALELISDMILKPHFEAEDLEREKDVVLQELGEARDTPNDIIFDDLWNTAFADQPLGRSVLGDEASIEAIGLQDLHDWRGTRYRAGSLSLVAAGKVDHDALVEMAAKRFTGLPSGEIDAPEPAGFTGGARVGRTKADQAHIALAFPAPAQRAPDYFAARFFSDILGGGMSSRLFQQVREDRGLAYSIYSQLAPYSDTGLFYVYAATARRESAAAAQLIEETLAGAPATLTSREVERVRTQARAGLLMSIESPWGQAAWLARQLSVHGRLVEPAELIAELAKVTLEDVAAAGARMLAGPRARATIGFPAVRAA
ncbi:MAG TPA: pitrilysin family protein [Allosphingosinicella sp.]|nr:pitrilysin family protein [Allosphingosinicella sp.]